VRQQKPELTLPSFHLIRLSRPYIEATTSGGVAPGIRSRYI
jgi:hypothetical protein